MKTLKADQLDQLLPQVQCGLCGHGGCMPYAQALADDAEQSNLCPPGGTNTLNALNQALAQNWQSINMRQAVVPSLGIAQIDEQWCIGCTKCIDVCPVDAIIGANKKMHTVLADCCTGCDLCLPVCPMDCITMLARDKALADDSLAQQLSRERALAKRQRDQRLQSQAQLVRAQTPPSDEQFKKNLLADILKKAALQSTPKPSEGSA